LHLAAQNRIANMDVTRRNSISSDCSALHTPATRSADGVASDSGRLVGGADNG
jgi:hypothetical protein